VLLTPPLPDTPRQRLAGHRPRRRRPRSRSPRSSPPTAAPSHRAASPSRGSTPGTPTPAAAAPSRPTPLPSRGARSACRSGRRCGDPGRSACSAVTTERASRDRSAGCDHPPVTASVSPDTTRLRDRRLALGITHSRLARRATCDKAHDAAGVRARHGPRAAQRRRGSHRRVAHRARSRSRVAARSARGWPRTSAMVASDGLMSTATTSRSFPTASRATSPRSGLTVATRPTPRCGRR
jgi:hypothetical protein